MESICFLNLYKQIIVNRNLSHVSISVNEIIKIIHFLLSFVNEHVSILYLLFNISSAHLTSKCFFSKFFDIERSNNGVIKLKPFSIIFSFSDERVIVTTVCMTNMNHHPLQCVIIIRVRNCLFVFESVWVLLLSKILL